MWFRTTSFGEAVAGVDEVLVSHRRSFIRESFAETEKAALRRACGLVAQFAVPNPRLMHAFRELPSHAIDVELLKSKEILISDNGLAERSIVPAPRIEGA